MGRFGPGGGVASEPTLITWNQDAAQALALARATPGDLLAWESDVTRGLAQLWRFDGGSVGYLLTRVETEPDGTRDLVLVAGTGKNARNAIAWATALADRHGLNLRTHIARPGLQRLYERAGWYRYEIVMRREYGQQVQEQE